MNKLHKTKDAVGFINNVKLHIKLFFVIFLLRILFVAGLHYGFGYALIDEGVYGFQAGVLTTKVLFVLSTITAIALIFTLLLLFFDFIRWTFNKVREKA